MRWLKAAPKTAVRVQNCPRRAGHKGTAGTGGGAIAWGVMHVLNERCGRRGHFGRLRGNQPVCSPVCAWVFPLFPWEWTRAEQHHAFWWQLLSAPLPVTGTGVGNPTLPSPAPVHLGKSLCGKEMISSTLEKYERLRTFIIILVSPFLTKPVLSDTSTTILKKE